MLSQSTKCKFWRLRSRDCTLPHAASPVIHNAANLMIFGNASGDNVAEAFRDQPGVGTRPSSTNRHFVDLEAERSRANVELAKSRLTSALANRDGIRASVDAKYRSEVQPGETEEPYFEEPLPHHIRGQKQPVLFVVKPKLGSIARHPAQKRCPPTKRTVRGLQGASSDSDNAEHSRRSNAQQAQQAQFEQRSTAGTRHSTTEQAQEAQFEQHSTAQQAQRRHCKGMIKSRRRWLRPGRAPLRLDTVQRHQATIYSKNSASTAQAQPRHSPGTAQAQQAQQGTAHPDGDASE